MKNLIFPKSFSQIECNTASKYLSGLDQTNAQLILDEVAGRLSMKASQLQNPIGYLRSLVSACRRGEFVPAMALSVQKKRAYRKQVEKAVRYSNEIAEREALKRLGLK